MSTILHCILRACLLLVTLPLPAADAFLPLRLGEVMPEGWMRAQIQRDLVSGFQGNLDALLQARPRHLHETGDPILTGAVTNPMHRRALEWLA